MSLLEDLLAGPGPQDRMMQLSQLQSLTQGGGSPSTPGAPFGGGAPYQGNLPPQELARQIARKLERRGFQVGGLEGFQGTGQISTGHIDNSQHYDGMAGDVTYGGGGRWGGQNAALDWVERWLANKYGDLITENIWEEPDHFDHLHYGTRPGG